MLGTLGATLPLKEQGVCHIVALPFTLKGILRQKKNKETQIFHHVKICLSFKKSSKRNQYPSRYCSSITNPRFEQKPKHIIFQKSSYKNRPTT
jgi:hypothetical protein